MTYLQALRTLVKAYKAARGVMPKGIDLLKMKMKARQKAIDSQKVVQAADRFDKGNWFRLNKKPAKEGFGKPKKVETEAEILARMKRENKEAVQRLRDKKKPREDKANGGSPNLPFPFFYEGAIPGGQPRPSLDHYDDDAGVKGLIVSTGNTTCSFTASSDERLKTDITDLTDGLTTINKLRPRKFKWISEGKDAEHDHGFVAQELYEDYKCRAVVVGGDDPKTDPWSVDGSKLVPMLVKALQEADAKIEALTLRVKTLEKA